MMTRNTARAAVAVGALVLAACSTVPAPIRTPVDGPNIASVRHDPDAFTGQTVRWGGRILGLTNEKDYSSLEVLGRRLQKNGRPIDSDASLGRFLIRVPGFLDPAEFKRGRLVTVVGTITGAETRNIGDHPYLFPRVLAGTVHLWEEYVRDPYYPYFYDPFYYPYYYSPYWRYPYFFYRPYFPHYYRHRPPIKSHRLPSRQLH